MRREGFKIGKNHVSLPQRISKAIRDQKLLKKGDTVIIGVSGGPDSVALLSILHNLQYALGIRLIAAHYNHNLHRSAGQDLEFVRNLAHKLNIPFTSAIRAKKLKEKGSLEDLLRQDRYRFFFKAAKKYKATTLALAHTHDDLAETVLMRILRGSGLQGLRGILPVRHEQGIKIIRPLLSTSKKDILNYLSQNRLSYRSDPTNRETDFLRNKVRLKLIPYLQKEYNPNISQTLANISKTLTTDYAYLQEESSKARHQAWARFSGKKCDVSLESYRGFPLAMKNMFLRSAFKHLTGNTVSLTSQHLREIDSLAVERPTGSVVHLPRKISVKKTDKTLVMMRRKA